MITSLRSYKSLCVYFSDLHNLLSNAAMDVYYTSEVGSGIWLRLMRFYERFMICQHGVRTASTLRRWLSNVRVHPNNFDNKIWILMGPCKYFIHCTIVHMLFSDRCMSKVMQIFVWLLYLTAVAFRSITFCWYSPSIERQLNSKNTVKLWLCDKVRW